MMQKMPVDVQFICEILSLSYKCDVKLKKMLYSFFLIQRLTGILILIKPTTFLVISLYDVVLLNLIISIFVTIVVNFLYTKFKKTIKLSQINTRSDQLQTSNVRYDTLKLNKIHYNTWRLYSARRYNQ